MGIRVVNKIRSTRQTRQPTVSAAKTKQRYKKRRNCKHKKSGCVCFIVVRLCAVPLRNWDIGGYKALCAAADSTAKLRISAKTRKNDRNKIRIILSDSNIPSGKTRSEETRLPDHYSKQGDFSPSSPRLRSVLRQSVCSCPIIRTPTRPRACTRLQPFFDNYLHPSPPTSISLKMCPLGVKSLHLFAVHRLHSKSVTATYLLFNNKAPSVRRLCMGELRLFSSFTRTFTLIPLIYCNLQHIDF